MKNETEAFSEYAEFCKEGITPPSAVSMRIHDEINNALMPNLKTTLGQLVLLHLITGGLTLIFCPQFGVGPLGGGQGLLSAFESYGHVICGLLCGSFFISLTILFSWICLRSEIQKSIRQNQFALYPILGVFSFSALLILSLMTGGSLMHLHFEFVMAWLSAVIFLPVLLNSAKKWIISYNI